MKGLVKIFARPKLKSPCMLAVWPGIGNVSMILASYLAKHLDFKRLGEIVAPYFFDPIGVTVRDSIVESPRFPESRFFYWKNTHGGDDIIMFIGEDQPASKGYALAHCVLDVAEKFQVKTVYTCAAAVTRIHHTEQPGVWGVATSQEIVESLKEYGLTEKHNVQIAGLNGLLLGIAKERGRDGVCLLGEVPSYATRIQNPMAALAVLRVLMKMLNIQIDLAELAQLANITKDSIKQAAAEAMEEYIDYFTEPIWERDEEEEGGEEEE